MLTGTGEIIDSNGAIFSLRQKLAKHRHIYECLTLAVS